MLVETVLISSLSTDPKNARRHGDRNLQSIVKSLESFGQQKPIVIDAADVVVAGNGTLAGAITLGWEKIQIVRTELTGNEAIAFAVADNRTSELAEWDIDLLTSSISELREAEEFRLLESIGFNEEEMAQFIASIDGEDGGSDPETEWEGMPEFENEDQNGIRLVVHFKTEEDSKTFSSLIGQSWEKTPRYIWFPPVEDDKVTSIEYADEGAESEEDSDAKN